MDRQKKNIVELTKVSLHDYHMCSKRPLKVLADSVRSMMNIGSVFRTADAFLIDEIILTGISGCPPHPEIHKTALGAEDSVKWSYYGEPMGILRKLKGEGWKICVLEQTHNSLPLKEFHTYSDEKYVLVIGNEVNGVDQTIVDMADHVLEIPQYGTKHSLNVSVSAGIALWHMTSC